MHPAAAPTGPIDAKATAANRLAGRGWPGAAFLLAVSIAAGLATFAMVMMKHDRRHATRVVTGVVSGTPAPRPLSRNWYGPTLEAMALGTALFSLGWAVPLACIVRTARDRYCGMRRAALTALVVAAAAATFAAAVFVVVRAHFGNPANAWSWGSWIAAKLSTGSVVVAGFALMFVRKRLAAYLEARGPRCPRCDYDVRGTVAAGGRSCSECGSTIPDEVAERALNAGCVIAAQPLGA